MKKLSDKQSKSQSTTDVTGQATGSTVEIIKAVADSKLVGEVYRDALQSPTREALRFVDTVAKLLNAPLEPFRFWAEENRVRRQAHLNQIEKEIASILKTREVPEEYLAPVRPKIAIPAIRGLLLETAEEELHKSEGPNLLRAQYLNLLASAMDTRNTSNAHVAFAFIMEQMSPEEAKLISFIANCDEKTALGQVRLPISSSVSGYKYTSDGDHILKHEVVERRINYRGVLGSIIGCDDIRVAIDNLLRLEIIEIDVYSFELSDEPTDQFDRNFYDDYFDFFHKKQAKPKRKVNRPSVTPATMHQPSDSPKMAPISASVKIKPGDIPDGLTDEDLEGEYPNSDERDLRWNLTRKYLHLTALGHQFCHTCVLDPPRKGNDLSMMGYEWTRY